MGGFTAHTAVLAATFCAICAAVLPPSAAANGVPDPQQALASLEQSGAAVAAPVTSQVTPQAPPSTGVLVSAIERPGYRRSAASAGRAGASIARWIRSYSKEDKR